MHTMQENQSPDYSNAIKKTSDPTRLCNPSDIYHYPKILHEIRNKREDYMETEHRSEELTAEARSRRCRSPFSFALRQIAASPRCDRCRRHRPSCLAGRAPWR